MSLCEYYNVDITAYVNEFLSQYNVVNLDAIIAVDFALDVSNTLGPNFNRWQFKVINENKEMFYNDIENFINAKGFSINSLFSTLYRIEIHTELLNILYSLFPEYKKINRNSFCPCGSGKKYKKCCLNFNF